MKYTNCPNCGAPFDLDHIKCSYCGTLCFDMGSLDLTDNTPIFMRYRVPYNKELNCIGSGDLFADITQCAIPRLQNVEVNNDTVDVIDGNGTTLKKISTNRTVATNLQFNAIPFGDKNELFTITIED